MHITHCLLSCDSNPEYLEFWPVVAAAWLKLGIQPVLFYIATDENIYPEKVADGLVHTFSPLPDIPIIVQACTLRFWGSRLYANNIVIISDMDLVPLSKKFFTDGLQDINDDFYVHKPAWPRPKKAIDGKDYSSIKRKDILYGHPIDQAVALSACYNIARGDVMSRILRFSDSWEEDCRKITPYWYKFYKDKPSRGEEIYSAIMVEMEKRKGGKIKLLPYPAEESNWINHPHRDKGGYDEEKLRAGFYSAIHCSRPYSANREIIHKLIDLHDSSSHKATASPKGEV